MLDTEHVAATIGQQTTAAGAAVATVGILAIAATPFYCGRRAGSRFALRKVWTGISIDVGGSWVVPSARHGNSTARPNEVRPNATVISTFGQSTNP